MNSYFADYRAQLKDVGNSPLSVKLKVINERDLYSMTGAQEEYELAVDIFSYANTLTGQTSSQQFEIEVEAKNDAAATRIPSMKSKLLSLLTSRGYDDFRFSEDSKYERGVKIMQLWQPTWLQYFSAWATRSNAALIMLILGVLGFVVGVVAIVVAK